MGIWSAARPARLFIDNIIVNVGGAHNPICHSRIQAETGRIDAIDISPGMLRVAQAKGFPAMVHFTQFALEALTAPLEYYDRVMCNAVFPHFIDNPAAAVIAPEMAILDVGAGTGVLPPSLLHAMCDAL